MIGGDQTVDQRKVQPQQAVDMRELLVNAIVVVRNAAPLVLKAKLAFNGRRRLYRLFQNLLYCSLRRRSVVNFPLEGFGFSIHFPYVHIQNCLCHGAPSPKRAVP